MSNPLYEMMEQMEIKKDIAEIDFILSSYKKANSIFSVSSQVVFHVVIYHAVS